MRGRYGSSGAADINAGGDDLAEWHALLNTASLGLYAVSWTLRPSRHRAGVVFGMAGLAVSGLSAYLGGHLATARKVGTRDAAYEVDGVGPQLRRPGAP